MGEFLKLTMEVGAIAYVHRLAISAFGQRCEGYSTVVAGSWVETRGGGNLSVCETVEEIAALIDSVAGRA